MCNVEIVSMSVYCDSGLLEEVKMDLHITERKQIEVERKKYKKLYREKTKKEVEIFFTTKERW